METLNAFFETIMSHIGSAIVTIVGQSFLFAMVSLIIAILFIQYGRKRGWFQRSFGLWTFVAKLNYIYLPVLFIVFGASTGVLKGVHSAAGNVIDSASDEFVAYGQAYIVDFQEYLASTTINVASVKVKDIVDAHLKAKSEMGWFSRMAASAFNMIIVRHCMSKAGMKDLTNDPIAMIETFNKRDLSTAILSLPSMVLHVQCDLVFWGFFVGLFTVFTPFFMFPVYEFLLHIVVRLISGSKVSNAQPGYSY